MSIKDGPGEGGWAVFAEKVVAERDAAEASRETQWQRAERGQTC